MRMAFIDLNVTATEEDKFGWLEVDELFSVCSAYDLHMGMSNEGAWPEWKIVWKIKVQQRIKTFIWTVAEGRILTNYCRWRRHLVDNPSCTRWCSANEDAIHTWWEIALSRRRYDSTACRQVYLTSFNYRWRKWLLKGLTFRADSSMTEIWPYSEWLSPCGSCGFGEMDRCLGEEDCHCRRDCIW